MGSAYPPKSREKNFRAGASGGQLKNGPEVLIPLYIALSILTPLYVGKGSHRPSWTGGVAARSRKCRDSDRNRAGGVVVRETSSGATTPALRATPPVQEGRCRADRLVAPLFVLMSPCKGRLHE